MIHIHWFALLMILGFVFLAAVLAGYTAGRNDGVRIGYTLGRADGKKAGYVEAEDRRRGQLRETAHPTLKENRRCP